MLRIVFWAYITSHRLSVPCLKIWNPKCCKIQNCLSANMMLWCSKEMLIGAFQILNLSIMQIFQNLKKIWNLNHFWFQAFQKRVTQPLINKPGLPPQPVSLWVWTCEWPQASPGGTPFSTQNMPSSLGTPFALGSVAPCTLRVPHSVPHFHLCRVPTAEGAVHVPGWT